MLPGEAGCDGLHGVGIELETRIDLVTKIGAPSKEIELEKEVDFVTLGVQPFQFRGHHLSQGDVWRKILAKPILGPVQGRLE